MRLHTFGCFKANGDADWAFNSRTSTVVQPLCLESLTQWALCIEDYAVHQWRFVGCYKPIIRKKGFRTKLEDWQRNWFGHEWQRDHHQLLFESLGMKTITVLDDQSTQEARIGKLKSLLNRRTQSDTSTWSCAPPLSGSINTVCNSGGDGQDRDMNYQLHDHTINSGHR